MVEKFATKVISGGKTTIPAKIRKMLNIREGDFVVWYVMDDGTIVFSAITPKFRVISSKP